jgi:hypothetical protein
MWYDGMEKTNGYRREDGDNGIHEDSGRKTVPFIPEFVSTVKRNGRRRVRGTGIQSRVRTRRSLIQELSFDPTLYKDARSLQMVEDNNLVTTFAIDSNTNLVRGIRTSNLPLNYIQACRVSWSKAMLDDSYQYAEWYLGIQRQYTTEQLWEQATDVGQMGESYNPSETRHPFIR